MLQILQIHNYNLHIEYYEYSEQLFHILNKFHRIHPELLVNLGDLVVPAILVNLGLLEYLGYLEGRFLLGRLGGLEGRCHLSVPYNLEYPVNLADL